MKKIVISIGLTLLLGPGIGHLYLRRFKRALLLILATVFFAFLLALKVARNIPASVMQADAAAQLFQNYLAGHPQVLFYFDAAFAALWAYAIVDSFYIARSELPPQPDSETEDD